MKLNLGSGDTPLDGYENWDIKTGQSIYPLDLPDESVEEIRASHVLEHFSHREVLNVLREWVRVLKPGGIIRLAVPDFQWIVENYVDGRDFNIQGYTMGGHVDEYDVHKCLFDYGLLSEMLESVGIVAVSRWVSPIQDCAALPVSLNLMGMKADKNVPAPPDTLGTLETPAPKPLEYRELAHDVTRNAVAVMTLPRLAFTDNLFCAMQAFVPLGITLERSGGVFWGQGLTRLFERHLDDGTEYIITLDYDTVFDQQDVLRLLDTMVRNPHIDALCPVQMRREDTVALFTVKSAGGSISTEYFQQETSPISSGHFGLTVIRVDSLRDLPRPWFQAKPDEEGRWGDGRVDEDVAFWHKWIAEGRTLHLANRIAVGHMELIVNWPSRDLTPSYQQIKQYHDDGKPRGIWA